MQINFNLSQCKNMHTDASFSASKRPETFRDVGAATNSLFTYLLTYLLTYTAAYSQNENSEYKVWATLLVKWWTGTEVSLSA